VSRRALALTGHDKPALTRRARNPFRRIGERFRTCVEWLKAR